MIKRAKPKDIDGLLGLVREFISESQWGWKYSEEHAIETLYAYITNEDTDVLYVDGYMGFALVTYDNDFCVEKIGYISKFYISKVSRGTEAGRKLTEACVAWFDYHGVAESFVTDTANIKEKTFKNLMAKFGYRACGDTLSRGNNEQS